METWQRAAIGSPFPGRGLTGGMRLIAVLVLAGLWLMHGVSATTAAGCHGVPVVMTAGASVTDPGTGAAANVGAPTTQAGMRAADAAPSRTSGAGSHGHGPCENCLSGQPPAPGELLLALFAALALVGHCLGVTGRLLSLPPGCWGRARRRGPPGLVGRALLTTVCVSRT